MRLLLEAFGAVVTYQIDRTRGLVIIVCVGELTAADLPETQRRLRADPEFDARFGLLFDVRQASFAGIDVVALRRAAATTPFSTSSPRAYLTGDKAAFGLMRLLQIYSDVRGLGGPLQVFSDMDDAIAWLRSQMPGQSSPTTSA